MGRPKGSKNVFSTQIKHNCIKCNKEFTANPSRKIVKYCSYICYWQDMKGMISPNLGKKASIETRRKISISQKGKFGHLNHSWKGGRHITKKGYVLIKSLGHPYCAKTGYVMEHRLVMEKQIGRYLKPNEVVHHINEIKSDNRIENLMLFFSKGEHVKHHYHLRKLNAKGQFK